MAAISELPVIFTYVPESNSFEGRVKVTLNKSRIYTTSFGADAILKDWWESNKKTPPFNQMAAERSSDSSSSFWLKNAIDVSNLEQRPYIDQLFQKYGIPLQNSPIRSKLKLLKWLESNLTNEIFTIGDLKFKLRYEIRDSDSVNASIWVAKSVDETITYVVKILFNNEDREDREYEKLQLGGVEKSFVFQSYTKGKVKSTYRVFTPEHPRESHPNIVPYYGSEIIQNSRWLLLGYVSGSHPTRDDLDDPEIRKQFQETRKFIDSREVIWEYKLSNLLLHKDALTNHKTLYFYDFGLHN